MKTLLIELDEELDAALEALSAKQGRDKAAIVLEVLQKYIEVERLKFSLQDPALAKLHEKLEDEEAHLAEEE
ncbi:MAG TPA: hypothetical protein VFA07_01115 [Chthonomonadaceae bacterium]|nr:hypothetical protein [Chthonomonadaceae bacterium]